MAFKLSKEQKQEITELRDAVQAATEALESFVTNNLVAGLQDEWDGKSEKWQASEKGQAVQEWINEWTEFSQQLPELDDCPEDGHCH
jgi:hypothetical protein